MSYKYELVFITDINTCNIEDLVYHTAQFGGAKNVPALLGLEVDHLDNTWCYENTSSHLN